VKSTKNLSFLTEDGKWEVHYYTFQTPKGLETYWFEMLASTKATDEPRTPSPLLFPLGGEYKGLKGVTGILNRYSGPTFVQYDLLNGDEREYDLYSLLASGVLKPYRPLVPVAH
jgi:hypothetical protein